MKSIIIKEQQKSTLARTGYSDKAILLTPAQVGLIFRFPGEP